MICDDLSAAGCCICDDGWTLSEDEVCVYVGSKILLIAMPCVECGGCLGGVGTIGIAEKRKWGVRNVTGDLIRACKKLKCELFE